MLRYLKTFMALLALGVAAGAGANPTEVDVCVYGGTSAGVIAAYSVAQSGKSVILVEPGFRLGGMSSGGLGYTDIGNKFVVTGLARNFYRRVGAHYGRLEQWIFEPSVAEDIFKDYISRGGVDVLYGHHLRSVSCNDGHIEAISVADATDPDTQHVTDIRAKEYIDCTYEGDLMAGAGVSYTVGREDNSEYGERHNGVYLQPRNHQFSVPIDPYVVPGDPSSGLLWGIGTDTLKADGSGDNKVQAYCYRICLTDSAENMVPITRPENYDSTRYELLVRQMAAMPDARLDNFFIWSMMPGRKTDINNRGGFSTDMIGANWEYPEADYARRAEIVQAHEDYTKGLLYFVGHDDRVPERVRSEMLRWGYPEDEYVDNGNWTPQLYVREARRMKGATVMTEAHCVGEKVVDDPVGYAAYTMDSHNCDRIVVDGTVKNEGNVEVGGFPPFPISYGALVPQRGEADNLLVPVCLSASHIAYGSIRMEPVFMVLAQASAIAACQAVDHGCDVQSVKASEIMKVMAENPLLDNSVPEILVDNSDGAGVRFDGDWATVKNAKKAYGPDYSVAGAADLTRKVEYMPDVRIPGQYQVYMYVPRVEGMASAMNVEIADGAGYVKQMTVKPDHTAVVGQAYGEWIDLGAYKLDKGASVSVSSAGVPGDIVADAVLFIPKEK